MTRSVQAVYEKGVLRPLEPLHLSENEQVTLTIHNGSGPSESDLLDTEFIEACAREADSSVSLEEVRSALANISGTMTEDFVAERDER